MNIRIYKHSAPNGAGIISLPHKREAATFSLGVLGFAYISYADLMKQEMTVEKIEQVRNSFQKALNRHGYGFQFSVLKLAENLSKKVDQDERSRWNFLFSEVPVEVQGLGTRIDFILSRGRSGPSNPFFYLVCECKRANPALSNWCFVRAPRVRRNRPRGVDSLLVETVFQGSEVRPPMTTVSDLTSLKDAFHVGVEVRAPKLGDEKDKGKGAIEDAVTQVLKGLNGYVEALANTKQMFEGTQTHLLPVIFTTAQLWISNSDLGTADLGTGNIDLSNDKFESVPWLWYQYHMSPGLKHSSVYEPRERIKVEEFIEAKYIRTIAIVSADGIEDFLLNTSRDFF